jgi:hypothetical protein
MPKVDAVYLDTEREVWERGRVWIRALDNKPRESLAALPRREAGWLCWLLPRPGHPPSSLLVSMIICACACACACGSACVCSRLQCVLLLPASRRHEMGSGKVSCDLISVFAKS